MSETKPDIRVRINMDHAPVNLHLLAPGGRLQWGRCRFELNPPSGGSADYYIVMANARPVDRVECAKENTLFMSAEPLEKKLYPRGFYRQFYRLLDTHTRSGHPRVETDALGMCWHVGLDLRDYTYRYGYDHLAALESPEKQNRVSVICSDAANTPGQRRRLHFLAELKRLLGDKIVHFGKGFEPINDKMDAILPYRFNLALENCEVPHYWTEKLADAYLGWAFPLYVGCTNLTDYFSADAFRPLDMNDLAGTAEMIKRMLGTPPTDAERSAVARARALVLDHYNPFAWCARWAERWYEPAITNNLVVRSHRAFRPFPQGWMYRLQTKE